MDLWVQQIEGGDPVQLTRDLAICHDPSFSPDGSRIVIHCGVEPQYIYMVPTFGGLAKKMAEGALPQFSPDGKQIAYLGPASAGGPRAFWIMPTEGGAAKEIKIGMASYGGPVWTPDGKGLLFSGDAPEGQKNDWFVVPVDGGPPLPTTARERFEAAGLGLGRGPKVTAGGFLFINGDFDSSNIYRLPFDAPFRKASGAPIPVVVGAGYNFSPTSSQDGNRVAFAVGNNLTANVWRAPVDPASGKVSGDPVRVTSGVNGSVSPSPSADGKRVACMVGTRLTAEVHIREISTGKDVRLVEAKEWSNVVLSPDGSTVAFSSDERRSSAIYAVPAAGGLPKKLCAACGRPVEWSRDQSKLLIDNAGPKNREIQILDVATGQVKPLLQHPDFALTMPRISPDGRLICFTALRPGRARRLYVTQFSGELPGPKEWTVAVEGADYERQPFWGPDGNLIYFLSERDGTRCIWAQRVDKKNGQPVGAAFPAHHMHQVRHNLIDIPDTASIGLSIAGGQMFYSSFELQSNVWLAERRSLTH
jgi:Tol biopolymer transport system component